MTDHAIYVKNRAPQSGTRKIFARQVSFPAEIHVNALLVPDRV